MSRCVVYQSGGFTNYGISYRKYSQEELAEMENRAMTENDAIYCLKADSELHSELCEECTLHGLVGCDHCQTDAIDVAIKALEEMQQYREIGTPEECQTAVEKQNANKELESHDEKHILECCISLMKEMVNEFEEWYRWQHGEDAIKELDEEERFCFRKSHFRIVQKLFLLGTHHSGGTSTRAKCEQLGVDSSEEIEFDWRDEE